MGPRSSSIRIKRAFFQFPRLASLHPNSRSHYYVCKMRTLIAMTLLLLFLSVTASPLKQAKIKRGGLDGRDKGRDPRPTSTMTASKHWHHPHPTPSETPCSSNAHSKHHPTPTKHHHHKHHPTSTPSKHHPTSNKHHPTSNKHHPTSNKHHPTSSKHHPTPSISKHHPEHPTQTANNYGDV
ncbi:hypothetical protein EDB92DRAFT_1070317 [Lactarius akahatsu]|uniref:Uncharacterized protein n=1 Tax=Lactarius akahatsu TaxID=416441 RepID=A0AAD4LDW9_9AGAM|nr:hypothetical protein EDB92DRAFT_1070317 [Lactarius akahatsu]